MMSKRGNKRFGARRAHIEETSPHIPSRYCGCQHLHRRADPLSRSGMSRHWPAYVRASRDSSSAAPPPRHGGPFERVPDARNSGRGADLPLLVRNQYIPRTASFPSLGTRAVRRTCRPSAVRRISFAHRLPGSTQVTRNPGTGVWRRSPSFSLSSTLAGRRGCAMAGRGWGELIAGAGIFNCAYAHRVLLLTSARRSPCAACPRVTGQVREGDGGIKICAPSPFVSCCHRSARGHHCGRGASGLLRRFQVAPPRGWYLISTDS